MVFYGTLTVCPLLQPNPRVSLTACQNVMARSGTVTRSPNGRVRIVAKSILLTCATPRTGAVAAWSRCPGDIAKTKVVTVWSPCL